MKLEGAEQIGFQSVDIGSIRDPYIIRQIDSGLERLRAAVARRIVDVLSSDAQYHFNIRAYGENGTMGPREPVQVIRSHELCLLLEATAESQEDASAIDDPYEMFPIEHLPVQ